MIAACPLSLHSFSPSSSSFSACSAPPRLPAPLPPSRCACSCSRTKGGETLINRCHACREVTLQRLREGDGIPNVRSLMLPGAVAVQGPFRGPGRTRILGERTCPPPPGGGVSEAAIRR